MSAAATTSVKETKAKASFIDGQKMFESTECIVLSDYCFLVLF